MFLVKKYSRFNIKINDANNVKIILIYLMNINYQNINANVQLKFVCSEAVSVSIYRCVK